MIPSILSNTPHPLIDIDWIREACKDPNLSIAGCLKEQDRVGPNALFDIHFYRSNYSSDIPQGMTCLEHFCRQTKEAPYNPNALFSTQLWHETVGVRLPNSNVWRESLMWGLGNEARFARQEMERLHLGQVIVEDCILGKEPLSGQEICLFVHYDKGNDVQSYVLEYLDALLEQGVCIYFLTNSESLLPSALKSLRGRVWRVLYTKNRAYDWGLYSIGVKQLKNNFVGHPILLANDSVVGTMNSLAPLFEKVRSGKAGITGAIDCWLHDWHLQSFFLYCSVETVESYAWREFWIKFRPYETKWNIVNSHEIGFSKWMMKHGILMQAGWQYNDLISSLSPDSVYEWRNDMIKHQWLTNPTTELWDVLLEHGFPFLKKWIFNNEIITGNMSHMCNLISKLSVSSKVALKN